MIKINVTNIVETIDVLKDISHPLCNSHDLFIEIKKEYCCPINVLLKYERFSS